MNRPKRTKALRQPALWASPLASMADVEARQHEERMQAQIRPFFYALAMQYVAIMLVFSLAFVGENLATTRAVTPSDRDSAWIVLKMIAETLAWAIGGMAFIELAFRTRLRRRWTRIPSFRIEVTRTSNPLTLVLSVMIATTGIGLLAVIDTRLAGIGAIMLFTPAALYLIISGIRRRVGWEPSCAKCGYPHPDDTLTTCPECGGPTPPRSHTAVILGRNTTSYPRIAAGLALFAASAALIAT